MHLAVAAPTTRPARRRLLSAALVCIATVCAIVGPAARADAYSLMGSHWRTGALRVYVNTTSGSYRTAINQAAADYAAKSHAKLTNTTAAGPMFTAAQYNAGATGYEGQTTVNAIGSVTLSAHSVLNTHYLAGAPVARLKVVWLHELGHGLGLGHVTPAARVMQKSASAAYSAGVRTLTSDEVSGVNHLY